jgi:hypothetical protein
MSFEERGVWAYLLAVGVAYAVYLAIVVPRLLHTSAAHVSYGAPLALTTVAAAVAALLLRSALEVARPSETGTLDVRDRDIARFAEYNSRWCLVAGSAAVLSLAFNHADDFWIANTTYLGLVAWLLAGSVLRLVAYHRGL